MSPCERARLTEIRDWASDDDLCVAHCRCVRDLLDEVAALRAQVTRLVGDHVDPVHRQMREMLE